MMSMTAVNAGLTAASAANNAMAQEAAHRARVDRCTVFQSRFEVAKASVAEKQEYASCVETLYPMPTTEGETYLIKGSIVIMLIALIVGAVVGWKEDGPLGSFMFGFGGAAMAGCVLFLIYITALGVGYLFT